MAFIADWALVTLGPCLQVTYKNLETWYEELQENCKGIPTIVVANKIDVDYKVTSKSFNFAAKRKLPFFFVSASDGTNVVKIFQVCGSGLG